MLEDIGILTGGNAIMEENRPSIVAGGGVALLRASLAIAGLNLTGDEKTGAEIIRRSCEEPVRQISGNAGYVGVQLRLQRADWGIPGSGCGWCDRSGQGDSFGSAECVVYQRFDADDGSDDLRDFGEEVVGSGWRRRAWFGNGPHRSEGKNLPE